MCPSTLTPPDDTVGPTDRRPPICLSSATSWAFRVRNEHDPPPMADQYRNVRLSRMPTTTFPGVINGGVDESLTLRLPEDQLGRLIPSKLAPAPTGDRHVGASTGSG